MAKYPDAFNDEILKDVLAANDAAPSLTDEERERLIDVAQTISGAMGALEEDNEWCLIGTEWKSFCENTFGQDDTKLNKFAIGVHEKEISATKGATLFTNTRIVQQTWLEGGDNRRSQYKTFIDDEYDDANEGDMWIPKSAQEYMLIVELKPELLHGKASIAEAM